MNQYDNLLAIRNEYRSAYKLWREIELRADLIRDTYSDFCFSRNEEFHVTMVRAHDLKKWYLAQDFAGAARRTSVQAYADFAQSLIDYRDDIIDMMNGFAAEHLAAYNALLERGIDTFDVESPSLLPFADKNVQIEALLWAEREAKNKLYDFEHAFWRIWLEHQIEIADAFDAPSIHPTVAYAMQQIQEQADYDGDYD